MAPHVNDQRVRRHFRFPPDLAERLDAEAAAREVSANLLVIETLRARFDHRSAMTPPTYFDDAKPARTTHRHKPASRNAAGLSRCACGAVKRPTGEWETPDA